MNNRDGICIKTWTFYLLFQETGEYHRNLPLYRIKICEFFCLTCKIWNCLLFGGLQSTGRKESDTTERLHFHFHYVKRAEKRKKIWSKKKKRQTVKIYLTLVPRARVFFCIVIDDSADIRILSYTFPTTAKICSALLFITEVTQHKSKI